MGLNFSLLTPVAAETVVGERGFAQEVKPATQCIPLHANQSIPTYIASNQCFELQGNNQITGNIVIDGKLFIKAGRSATMMSQSSITLQKGGELTVRGQLEIGAFATLVLNEATFTCQGLISALNGAQILATGNNDIRNIGRLLLEEGSTMHIGGQGTFRSTGRLVLEQATAMIAGTTAFTNGGIISLQQGSRLILGQKANMNNIGRLQSEPDCVFALQGQSYLTNNRGFQFTGTLSLADGAILQNEAPLRMRPESYFDLSQSSQILNHHTIEVGGKSLMQNSARVLNDGVFAIKKTGTVRLSQGSLLLNTGTFRNEGGVLTTETQHNFKNEHIVSGRYSRDQGH